MSTISYAKQLFITLLTSFCISCTATPNTPTPSSTTNIVHQVHPANERLSMYLPLIKNKKVALVVNHTSTVGNTHLLDTLISLGVNVQRVFVPEHGFRGNADAGQKINNSVDEKTGISIVSLYGNHKKPTPADMKGINMVIYDLQDVGTRFYTYISTLHYVMEACAETNSRPADQGGRAEVLVLDRPNPQGDVVDGPMREADCKSFVGLDPLPILYGMTPAELACMINGEGWLDKGAKCMLRIIPMEEYSHNWKIALNCQPSPNLRNDHAIALYPSLCLFEGTNVSVGRGTDFPFEVIGSPYIKESDFSFTPKPSYGAASPVFNETLCRGVDLRNSDITGFSLEFIADMHKRIGDSLFWSKSTRTFDILAGSTSLRKQLKQGLSTDSIRLSWEPQLNKFKAQRKRYLIYDRQKITDRKPITDWDAAMHSHWVDSIYNSLSLRERIAQMVWVTLDVNFTEKSIQKIESEVKSLGVGGILVLKATPSDCLKFTERMDRASKVPLLFAADAENGLGFKFINVDKFPYFKELGEKGDSSFVRLIGERTAEQMLACGLNINFSPDVDVNTNPKNPIIGKRAFGDNVDVVSKMGEAYVRGLQSRGVCAVIKHFPGHGDTSTDSHLALPVVAHDSSRLANVELAPFRHCINNGAMGVMSGHLVVPALDPSKRAASLSPAILKGVLREKMNFNGIIVTDAINMAGARKSAGDDIAEMLAIKAGNDVVEFSLNAERAVSATEQAVLSGSIPEAQIETSVRRILAVKEWSKDSRSQSFGYPEAIVNLPITR